MNQVWHGCWVLHEKHVSCESEPETIFYRNGLRGHVRKHGQTLKFTTGKIQFQTQTQLGLT